MMSVTTVNGFDLSSDSLKDYFEILVNRFFKILPMRENKEDSLRTYMMSLSIELSGFSCLVPYYKTNHLFITLLSILEYLIDNQDCDIDIVRREIFHAISICNKLKESFS